MSISARTRITTLGAALVLGAIVAGCGGSTPAATTAPTAVATAEPVVSAAPATPVVAPTELPKKLCLVIPAKIEGVKINNPALKGTIAPIIALVAGKPICVLGNGGTPVGDTEVLSTVQAGDVTTKLAMTVVSPTQVKVAVTDGTTVASEVTLDFGAAPMDVTIGAVTLHLALSADEESLVITATA